MTVHFYLLGSFETQVGTAERKPLGNALATQIIAFLAFRNRFCSRDEIVEACWGEQEAAGVNDEAYQKQIYKARDLFTNVLGLPWQDHFYFQRDGAQIKEGVFTTDVIQFDELCQTGMNKGLPDAARLDALRKADRLRRGYFLDGMNAEWIISKDSGARSEYGAKVRELQREIQHLQALSEISSPNRVPYCNGFYDAIPTLRKTVGEATREIIFYGINFHVTIPVIYDLLVERLQAGVKLKFLLLDPHGDWTKELAAITADEEQTLREEGILSLRRLASLSKQLTRDDRESPLLEVSVFDGMIPGRMYAIDPDAATGQLFYFPYMNGVSPTRLPGYLWPRKPDSPYGFYTNELRRLWTSTLNIRISTVSDDGALSRRLMT